jgi:hypothetical protein
MCHLVLDWSDSEYFQAVLQHEKLKTTYTAVVLYRSHAEVFKVPTLLLLVSLGTRVCFLSL